jgi:ABC transporter
MNIIESSGLGKWYGSTWALRDCTLTVPAGHVVALVGPNGAGKTTQFCPAPPVGARVVDKPPPGSLAQCLSLHGYTQWTSYQPASRFWPFQWVEGGWLLVLSLFLFGVTVWLVRRRAA